AKRDVVDVGGWVGSGSGNLELGVVLEGLGRRWRDVLRPVAVCWPDFFLFFIAVVMYFITFLTISLYVLDFALFLFVSVISGWYVSPISAFSFSSSLA